MIKLFVLISNLGDHQQFLEGMDYNGLVVDYNDIEAAQFQQHIEYASNIPEMAKKKLQNVKHYATGRGIFRVAVPP